MADKTPLQSLVATGTKLWLDSIDPQEVATNRSQGATGATSNPIIIADLLKTGRFDDLIAQGIRDGHDDEGLAWHLTNHLVSKAQEVFLPVWEQTKGNDGFVSFELDPLLEDASCTLSEEAKSKQYIELGKKWAAEGPKNRMIKVPATPGGLGALEELAASGVSLNVTLIFSERQYTLAREAIWRGARRRATTAEFKSVYSIFVSRVDVYTEQKVPELSAAAQGLVGIVNAKRIWRLNQAFWENKNLALKQEMIFASTGTKKPEDAPWKYVEAFAGSDIETNPPATNRKVQESGRLFTRHIDEMPTPEVLAEIDAKVDVTKLEETLMQEGLEKFSTPFKGLLELIASKRKALQVSVG